MAITGLAGLVDPNAELERLAGDFGLIEGPIWIGGTLYFNDIPASRRYAWSPDAGLELLSEETHKANGMDFDPQGRVYVCEHTTSSVSRFAGPRDVADRTVIASHYAGRELNSPNDVVYGPDGYVYFTDPAFGRDNAWVGLVRERELDFAGVFRADPDGDPRDVALVAQDFGGPNGLCFSPDGRILYVNDTPRKNIRALTLGENGEAVADRMFYDLSDDGEGGVDGMECDEHGNVWVTGPGGIWAISPAGEKLGVVGIPGPPPDRALSLVFGGPERRDLFITAWSTLYRIPTLVRGHRDFEL